MNLATHTVRCEHCGDTFVTTMDPTGPFSDGVLCDSCCDELDALLDQVLAESEEV